MSKTEHYQLQKPEETKTVEQEIRNLQTVFDQLDAILRKLRTDVDDKSASNHRHEMEAIEGLVDALSKKMAADKTFSLSDLTDVIGTVEAALGYILVKTAEGWQAQSAAAALGDHKHNVQDITNLPEALDSYLTKLAADDTYATKNTVSAALEVLENAITKKLDKNNPNFTGTASGTRLSLKNGNNTANRNLLGFGFDGDTSNHMEWILRSDGVLVLCKMNPATGAWEQDLLQVHPSGVVQAANTLKVSGAEVHTNGNVSGAMWDLTGTLDLWNYINKMTWGKTSVELGFAVYANEDWGWRETVAPWTKCLALCVSKTSQTQDERRRPRKIEGQHDWGWETWASMAGADEWGAEIAASNTTGDRTMFSLAYTTMGRFRVSGGWGRSSERMAFLRVA